MFAYNWFLPLQTHSSQSRLNNQQPSKWQWWNGAKTPTIASTSLRKHFIIFDWLISIQLETAYEKINLISELKCPHLCLPHFTNTHKMLKCLDQLYNSWYQSQKLWLIDLNIYETRFFPLLLCLMRVKKMVTIYGENYIVLRTIISNHIKRNDSFTGISVGNLTSNPKPVENIIRLLIASKVGFQWLKPTQTPI